MTSFLQQSAISKQSAAQQGLSTVDVGVNTMTREAGSQPVISSSTLQNKGYSLLGAFSPVVGPDVMGARTTWQGRGMNNYLPSYYSPTLPQINAHLIRLLTATRPVLNQGINLPTGNPIMFRNLLHLNAFGPAQGHVKAPTPPPQAMIPGQSAMNTSLQELGQMLSDFSNSGNPANSPVTARLNLSENERACVSLQQQGQYQSTANTLEDTSTHTFHPVQALPTNSFTPGLQQNQRQINRAWQTSESSNNGKEDIIVTLENVFHELGQSVVQLVAAHLHEKIPSVQIANSRAENKKDWDDRKDESQEKDELMREQEEQRKQQIKQEKQQLQKEKQLVLGEKRQVIDEKQHLQREKQQLQQEKRQMQKEKKQVQQEKQQLLQEKHQLQQEKQQLLQQKEELLQREQLLENMEREDDELKDVPQTSQRWPFHTGHHTSPTRTFRRGGSTGSSRSLFTSSEIRKKFSGVAELSTPKIKTQPPSETPDLKTAHAQISQDEKVASDDLEKDICEEETDDGMSDFDGEEILREQVEELMRSWRPAQTPREITD